MIAVRVTVDVESQDGEVVIDNGSDIEVVNGHLFVYTANRSELLAAFAPSQWLGVLKDARFS